MNAEPMLQPEDSIWNAPNDILINIRFVQVIKHGKAG